MPNETFNSEEIIEEILRGGEKALRTMYPRYKKSFMAWAKSWSHGFDEDTLIEAYMEAVKVFYINVTTGRLTSLKSSVENYLIGVGRFYLMKRAASNKKVLPTENLDFDIADDENFLTQTIASELDDERKLKMRKGFALLGQQCQKILTMFYLEQKKSPEIRDAMNFDNDNTMHASKSRCLAQLRKLILNEKK
jgi:DNA-directed RNA polymerase specialized sigma24 family protein